MKTTNTVADLRNMSLEELRLRTETLYDHNYHEESQELRRRGYCGWWSPEGELTLIPEDHLEIF